MITKYNVSGGRSKVQYPSVEKLQESDNEWKEEMDNECELYVTESEFGLSLHYSHDGCDDMDTYWIILRTEVSDEEWSELLTYYKKS